MFKVWDESQRISDKISKQGIRFLLGGCVFLAMCLFKGTPKRKRKKGSIVSNLENSNIEKEDRVDNVFQLEGSINEYETYENYANPHITIHVSGCSQLRKRGGDHKYNNGKYRRFPSVEKATAYANTVELPMKQCKFCVK